jgi:hypothetical protein
MLHVPERLTVLLSTHRALHAAVLASLEDLGPWLESGGKRPTFFPDYTDHGVQHIEEVLKTAVSLITEDAWSVMTPGDAAVLILSTLLHDSAMHLTRDGFEALMSPDGVLAPIDFGDKPWLQHWADYIVQVHRFDERQLRDLFGSSEPACIPDLHDLRLDDRARRLIGEFVRHHHSRLAHQIARYGVPGPAAHPPRIHGEPEIVDLAGLVARSHGLPVRSCLSYLKNRFGRRTNPVGVHAVFLIVLLRVADYLQIQSGRAPERTLSVHKIHSPYSAVEWQVHAAVKDIQIHEEDREALYILAKPAQLKSFLRLKNWLAGLQAEIDASWAVLGEVYSRQDSGMERLGIKVRRILSNLDDESSFEGTIEYLPRRFAFGVAGADLLNLLVQPLYGDRPEIGVRELIQNSVDAVHELEGMQARGLATHAVELPEQDADVLVTIDLEQDGCWWLTISDCGIGMTADVIDRYFLRAGASLRTSIEWREKFADEKNRSSVLRTGRFGIGALAAFLLGEELHVSTRYVFEETGLCFQAKIATDPIEVRKCARPVGTTVRIKLWSRAVQPLLAAARNNEEDVWDWYCLEKPAVVRRIGSRQLRQKHWIPGPSDTLLGNWRRLEGTVYDDVHWTHYRAPALTCNGIVIAERTSQEVFVESAGLSLCRPALSIFDRDGKLPLTLQRTALSSPLVDLEEMLLTSVIKDYIAHALKTAPEADVLSTSSPEWYMGTYVGLHGIGINGTHDPKISMWGSTDSGIVPVNFDLLRDIGLKWFVVVPIAKVGHEWVHVPTEVPSRSVAILLEQRVYLVDRVRGRPDRSVVNRVRSQLREPIVAPFGELQEFISFGHADSTARQGANLSPRQKTRFTQLWNEIIGSPFIPFKKRERKPLLSRAVSFS